jgi:hypothetical protein
LLFHHRLFIFMFDASVFHHGGRGLFTSPSRAQSAIVDRKCLGFHSLRESCRGTPARSSLLFLDIVILLQHAISKPAVMHIRLVPPHTTACRL